MTLQEYKKVRMVFIIVLAMAFSASMQLGNYLVPVAILIVGSLLSLYLRRRVQGVVADERDYATGGKAALLAIQVYSWVAVVAMFIFYGLKDVNPSYEPIGMTLAFSTMVLMLSYAVIFRYYDKFSLTDKKLLYSLFMLLLFGAMFVVSVRTLSGEDTWVCEDGEWTEHGHPSWPAPRVGCE